MKRRKPEFTSGAEAIIARAKALAMRDAAHLLDPAHILRAAAVVAPSHLAQVLKDLNLKLTLDGLAMGADPETLNDCLSACQPMELVPELRAVIYGGGTLGVNKAQPVDELTLLRAILRHPSLRLRILLANGDPGTPPAAARHNTPFESSSDYLEAGRRLYAIRRSVAMRLHGNYAENSMRNNAPYAFGNPDAIIKQLRRAELAFARRCEATVGGDVFPLVFAKEENFSPLEADVVQGLMVNELYGGITGFPHREPSIHELAQVLRPLQYPRNVAAILSTVDTLEHAAIVERQCSAGACRLTDCVQLTHHVVSELLTSLADDPSSDLEIDLFLKEITALQDIH
jgi:hypothetical protein